MLGSLPNSAFAAGFVANAGEEEERAVDKMAPPSQPTNNLPLCSSNACRPRGNKNINEQKHHTE